jgi:acetyl esterase/lipase
MLRTPACSLVLLAVLTLAGSASGAPRRTCMGASQRETVAYAQRPGMPANATSLDVYAPTPGCRVAGRRAPVVVWVHGGGYRVGDKANQIAAKRRLLNARGWVFVSVNYRLTVAGGPGSAHYPDHYRDVAAAVAWIRAHIAARGGNPHRIALLGHSAGADIVANVTTNPAWLAERGLGLRAVRCAGPLDTAGFDKTRVPATSPEQVQWREALGTDPAFAQDTSATLLARAGTGIPPTLTVVRGTPLRRAIETDYAARLRALGVPATVVDASSLTHAQVSTRIGAPGDTVMTPPLMRFLTSCLHGALR